MTRRRRKNIEVSNTVWKIGAYIRLSREDGKDVSVSIENQFHEINDFIQKIEEPYEVIDYYKDDGFSGTDSNRKNFQRLLNDIKAGNVNCVIVRDPSRLSRNYIEAGMYMEQLFVEFNVRFISLSLPQLDSYKSPDMMNSIALPIQNVINDDFCRQTSQKIRGVFNMKRSRGEFIGAFAPYGYKKANDNKNQLIVDEEAAQVIKMIYHLFVYEGMSKGGIARELNRLTIVSPAKYKQLQGLKFNNQGRVIRGLWSPSTVLGILSNRMYIGDMIQGKHKVKSYKVHDLIKVAKEDWFVVEQTHEAIIAKETFEKAQMLHEKDTRTTPGKKNLSLFSGFLKCGDCGMGMRKSGAKGMIYYYCRTNKEKSKTSCTKHSIRFDELEKAVLKSIQLQIMLVEDVQIIMRSIHEDLNKHKQSQQYDKLIHRKQSERSRLQYAKECLYVDWKADEISSVDYHMMSDDFDLRLQSLQQDIDKLIKERDGWEEAQKEPIFMQSFLKYKNITELDRALLICFIDSIYIYEEKRIQIQFCFEDQLKKCVTYLQKIKKN